MVTEIKLIKPTGATQSSNETLFQFVANNVTPKPSDYILAGDEEEVTSLENLRAMKHLKIIDDRAYRSGLFRLESNAGSFANLSSEEKRELALRFATSGANIASEFPDVWDRVANGLFDFHQRMVESRKSRFQWCASLLYNTVGSTAASVVINKIRNDGLYTLYTEFGGETKADDGNDALFDYVNSTTNTIYFNAGLLEDINGNMIAGTITESECIDKMNDCLRYGIYYGV